MSLDTDVYSYLASLAGSNPVEENKASETSTQPRIFFQRSSGNVDLLLNGNVALNDTSYDVEVYGLDVDAAASLADTLKTTLHGHRGTMGSTTVLAMFVQDAADDYVPKMLDADEGYHVFAFQLQILT